MSKKYKRQLCIYCSERESSTADHVIARQFFLPNRRKNLPKVPACTSCNSEKSKLEHYLATILPFGGRHTDSDVNLKTNVPKRLGRNVKLHRQLTEGLTRLYPGAAREDSLCLPIDEGSLEKPFSLIAKGLAWYYWKISMGTGFLSSAAVISESGEHLLNRFFTMGAHERISVNLGEGTFCYEGLQASDPLELTIWRFSIYGGLSFAGDPRAPNARASTLFAITGPDSCVKQIMQDLSS